MFVSPLREEQIKLAEVPQSWGFYPTVRYRAYTLEAHGKERDWKGQVSEAFKESIPAGMGLAA